MPCPLINIIFLDILGQTKIKVAFIVGMLCIIFKLRIIPFLRRLPYHYWDTSFWRYVWYPPYPLSCRLIVLFPFPLFAHSFFCKIRWIVRKIIAHENFFIVWNELTQVWAIFASEFLIDIQWRSLILIKKWRSWKNWTLCLHRLTDFQNLGKKNEGGLV